MPRRTPPKPIDAQARDEVESELDDMITQLAAEIGPAEGATIPTDADELAFWGQMDPTVDYDTLKQQLMTGSVPPELYDPASDTRLALFRLNKGLADDLAALFAVTPEEPLDDEMAGLVAELAEYPGRLTVLAPYEDDPEQAVAKAESVDGKWRRRTGQVVDTEEEAALPVPMPVEQEAV